MAQAHACHHAHMHTIPNLFHAGLMMQSHIQLLNGSKSWSHKTFLHKFTNSFLLARSFHATQLLSYYDISLLYSRIHLKWTSLHYCAKSWRQNYLWVDLTLKTTPPPYFLIRFPDQVSHTFVLFKDVTLTLINYLETWLRSDNTSCYYIVYVNKKVRLSKKCE